MSIQNSSFSIGILNTEVYQLNVDFLSCEGKVHSSKQFTFTRHKSELKREVIDVYSLNGLCSESHDPLSGIFTGKGVKWIKSAANKINLPLTISTILTVDIKGKTEGYLDPAIGRSEKAICDLFKEEKKTSSKSAGEARKQLKNKLDYVFCEGMLKTELLKTFEDSQVSYLNSTKGAQDYCQLTEIFMNAAKFGHKNNEIESDHFIETISEVGPFQPHQVSTIWYPDLYKESCKKVVKMFEPAFTIESVYELSTGMTLVKMKESL